MYFLTYPFMEQNRIFTCLEKPTNNAFINLSLYYYRPKHGDKMALFKVEQNDYVSWVKTKRTPPKDPCSAENNKVNTADLDPFAEKGVSYVPPKLTETTCTGNSLNPRGKYSCIGFKSGDCQQIITIIEAWKYRNGSFIGTVDIFLNVGCACHIIV